MPICPLSGFFFLLLGSAVSLSKRSHRSLGPVPPMASLDKTNFKGRESKTNSESHWRFYIKPETNQMESSVS